MRYIVTFSLLFIAMQISLAQPSRGSKYCAVQKHHSVAKTTILSPAEDDYDVKYVKLNLSMTDTSTYISGDATTNAIVAVSSMPQYVFELNNVLAIDSLKFDGVLKAVVTSGDLRMIMLTSALAQNAAFSVQVFYHGQTPSGTTDFGSGINNALSPTTPPDTITYTYSDPYNAKDWWPCKQSLTDKIDSTDVWVTVPVGTKAGSNGLLQAITPVSSTLNRYEWKERNSIDYYLISASVSNYIDYSFYAHFTGSTDSVLVQNYVYDSATLLANKAIIDSIAFTIDYFSTLYGRYPFWKEKYGHCMAPDDGGMEHQTMTTLSYFEGSLVAHELAHQWFGDNVTCGTWKDMFMNEAFAQYSEYIFATHFRSPAAGTQFMNYMHSDALLATGPIYISDTTNADSIFDGSITYAKGASVLHMLRFVINNDSLFFQAYKNYQQQYAGGTATVNDFKNIAAQVSNQNLDTFFNQWVYDQGYPVYAVSWNQVGSQVYVKISQTASVPSSVALFVMPIDMEFLSPQGDTIVRINNNQTTQVYTFSWDRPMFNLFFDPNQWLLYKLFGGVAHHDPTLAVEQPLANIPIAIYPNPATSNWQIDNLQNNSSMRLTDMAGRTLWRKQVQGESYSIPAIDLVPGAYLLYVSDNEDSKQVYKLIKQ